MSVVTKAAAPIVDTAADGEERRSLERLVKMFARFVGTGYVAYFLILLPEIRRTAFLTPTWWNWFCVIAVFGTGLLFGLSSFSGSIRAIRMAGSIAAVTYLLCVLGWWLAWDQTLFDVQGVYLSTFPGLASLAAASVWPPVLVFVHMTVGVIAAQSINYVLREPFVTTPLFADIVFGMMFCTIFVAATLAALRTARILDATITRTQAQAARSAAAAARAVERERFDALTHDGVMSSLLSVARQGRSPSVVNQARLTLRQLDSLRTHSAPTFVDADEAIAQLRATANDVDESVIVHIESISQTSTSNVEPQTYPADAVRAIGAALAEAMRNSLRHAGPSNRSVTVRTQPGILQATVTDDGVGFDRASVPPHRLGVAVSIEGRLRQLPGGASRIDSIPGQGTTVHLTWCASDVPRTAAFG
ncbi:ATP-binding protein [Rhodococcus sp. BGS-1C]|jgi:signal transduction histidine kinase|uniref:sensor histidine kinase n=1 Tax=Nocardiaceae TaxID=85025 RepID=UPI0019D2F745|nr:MULTISPECIES: ATP-binding protein [Rhodococcus]MCC8927423.1 ATP-binding protein [Rhodococcus sp. I2R]MCZ4276332.1 ATP-binding protein [Rhodococcus yunnanensis]